MLTKVVMPYGYQTLVSGEGLAVLGLMSKGKFLPFSCLVSKLPVSCRR